MTTRRIRLWILEQALLTGGANIEVLAKRSGFSVPQLQAWLRGTTEPTDADLERLIGVIESTPPRPKT